GRLLHEVFRERVLVFQFRSARYVIGTLSFQIVNPHPYSLDDLIWFVRIADAGGLSRASRALDVPKSTLSRRLSRMEAAGGVTLLQRNSRSSSLTDAGRRLVDQAAPLLKQLESVARDLLAQEASPRGLVRISASGSFGKLVVVPLVTEYLKEN